MEDWKDLMDQIRSASEDIEVPEELKPEAVERMLKERAQSTAEGKGTPGKWKRRSIRTWGSLAAAAMVALVVWTGVGRIGLQKASSTETAVVTEECAEETMEECIEEAAAEEPTEEMEEYEMEGPIATAGSYEEIYELLGNYAIAEEGIYRETTDGTASGAVEEPTSDVPASEEAVFESADVMEDKNNSISSETEEYSATNLREEGVDEADIVKTDGRYIYTCAPSSSKVTIVRAEDLEICAEITLENTAYIAEFYVENERLTILANGSGTELATDEQGLYYSEYRTETTVFVYDLTDPEHPEQIGEVGQEGSYYSSRKVGDFLYLFTSCRKQRTGGSDNVASYIPEVDGRLLSSDCIYLPDTAVTGRYLLISSLNLKDPEEFVDAKGILCDSTDIYISTQNIYIWQNRWDTGVEQTEIFKFWFYRGMIFSRAVGLVEGMLSDSFCIDEYEGKLRVVTTAWVDGRQKSSLYVLDGELKVVGSLEDVAPGEEVKSARLMGDTGYFVTFRQVDPLFCVDLTDPEEPKFQGELKVSGFSSYLHPYGEGLLLGMGQEADESTGRFEGYKISIFDISEAGDMEELDKVVFQDVSLVGLGNYKTVLADPDKNIIGVCLEKWNRGEQTLIYRIYGYDRESQTFEKLLGYEMLCDKYMEVTKVRTLYIGDMLYITSPKEISAFDMSDDFNHVKTLQF